MNWSKLNQLVTLLDKCAKLYLRKKIHDFTKQKITHNPDI